MFESFRRGVNPEKNLPVEKPESSEQQLDKLQQELLGLRADFDAYSDGRNTADEDRQKKLLNEINRLRASIGKIEYNDLVAFEYYATSGEEPPFLTQSKKAA